MTLTLTTPLEVDIHTVTVHNPAPPLSGYFKLGTAQNPAGDEISIDSQSLLFNGKPWFPVMGEIHFSRYPRAEWREALEKMKAGGIHIVSTYVFWNHHEEVEGEWDWEGQKDLRAFLETCREVGLLAIVRAGPWCNGEVRYGGFPDWIQNSTRWAPPARWGLRPEHPDYDEAVRHLYAQIGGKMRGLLWKDGGPVVAIQLDNEYSGPSRYLLGLKNLALETGMDVPLFTKTGWPRMEDSLPAGEMIPFYGAYPDAAWEGTVEKSESLLYNYIFRKQRIDESIASDVNTVRGGEDESSRAQYPFLTAETGGGMFVSYHRRNKVEPRDVASLALCQVGSGCAGIGYYMYHGGENPEGRLTSLHKSNEIGDVFDTPVRSYDFQAPIGQYGQIRPHYHWLRRLNFFVEDFGADLARMPAFLPAREEMDFSNPANLRWSVRSNGQSGFLFVNNYQRLEHMPGKPHTQFRIDLPGGSLTIPSKPVTIPADSFFHWPFHLDLNGVKLIYATAQPIRRTLDPDGGLTAVFAEVPGMNAEFAFDPATIQAPLRREPLVFSGVRASRSPAIRVSGKNGREVRIILLTEADSLALAAKTQDGSLAFDAEPTVRSIPVELELLENPNALRSWKSQDPEFALPVSPGKNGFQSAAVWKVKLPADLDMASNPILRIRYTGDVARLTLNGRLLNDDFYNGSTFETGLRRHAAELASGELRLEILPLQKDMPVYFDPGHRPEFNADGTALRIDLVEIQYTEPQTPTRLAANNPASSGFE
ncbi:MAG: beta-galactosidase [Spartobacteria bacterium]